MIIENVKLWASYKLQLKRNSNTMKSDDNPVSEITINCQKNQQMGTFQFQRTYTLYSSSMNYEAHQTDNC